jgi:hypothetical protein
MENEKHSSFIGIINSEKWKQLKGYFNIYLIGYKNFDYSKPENEIIEHTQNLFSNIDKQIRNALDYLLTNNITSTEKIKIFAYSKELNKLKFDCEQKLISLNAKPLNYELLYFDYMDLVDKPKKEVSKYAYEIEKEFNEFIKIEVSENLQTQNTTQKSIIDRNDLKFQICLNFANGKIYELDSKGLSHPKKVNELFNKYEKQNSIYQYIKCTYANNLKDVSNKNKNLFNDYVLIEKVKEYCNEKGIEINHTFLKEYNKHMPKE